MRINVWLAVLAVAAAFLLAGCKSEEDKRFQAAAQLTNGGDPQAGRVAIRHYGCNGCHSIPGVPGANGVVGPPLTNMSQRVFIAGTLPNTVDNMMKWIQKPQDILPRNAMPNMGVSDKDSRDITAYLYSTK